MEPTLRRMLCPPHIFSKPLMTLSAHRDYEGLSASPGPAPLRSANWRLRFTRACAGNWPRGQWTCASASRTKPDVNAGLRTRGGATGVSEDESPSPECYHFWVPGQGRAAQRGG
jgi:hypothetical protein